MQNLQTQTPGESARAPAREGRVPRPPERPRPQSALRGVFLSWAIAVTASAASGQLSTQDHLAEPGFWPTQEQASRAEFVGAGACARCHEVMTATQQETPMAMYLAPAQTAEILHDHRSLAFTANKFEYRIETDAIRCSFSFSG